MSTIRRTQSSITRTLLMLLLALCVTASPVLATLIGGAEFAYGEGEAINITESTTIDESGIYTLDASLSNAVISVATTEPVTLIGRGIGDATTSGPTSLANTNVSIAGTVAGINITLHDVFLNTTSGTSNNTIELIGEGNSLTFTGTSDIENQNDYATIHVPASANLTIDGTGTLYSYRNSSSAMIGGNQREGSGAITIDGITMFAKGTKMGAVIGSGAYATEVPGDITINGGEFNFVSNARGAVFGSGASAEQAPGNVYINGGTINMNLDFSGSAIGNGNGSPLGGNVFMAGGSVRTYVDENAVGSWRSVGVTEAGVSPLVITSNKLNGAGDSTTYLLPFDTAQLDTLADNFVVSIDDSPFYTGGLHRYFYIQEDKNKDLGQQLTITTTPTNWVLNPDPDTCLYFYVTGDDHTLNVNGEVFDATWDEDGEYFVVTPGEVAVVPEGWDGVSKSYEWYTDNEEGDNYIISTPEELAGFAAIVNGTADGLDVDDFAGKTITQGADIVLDEDGLFSSANGKFGTNSYPMQADYYIPDVNSNKWTPIGSATATGNTTFSNAKYFQGTFDGAGYCISGLYTDGTLTTQGLFGCVGGTVKNVNVTSGLVAAKIVAGGIVANLNGGTVENCTNAAHVYADGGQVAGSGLENGMSRGGAIGGVVGNATGTTAKPFLITGNQNSGNVYCTNTSRGGRTGGILGLIDLATDVGTVQNCLNSGDINSYQYSGGIVGLDFSKVAPIDGCVNHGSVQANSSGSTYGGGIVSQCYSAVSNCYNTGNNIGALWSADKTAHHGGIVSDLFSPGTITNCYNTGRLELKGTAVSSSSTGKILGSGGGRAGTAAQNIFNSYYLNIDSSLAEFADVEQGWLVEGSGFDAEDMMSDAFVLKLGDAFNKDSDATINGGFPVLAWQGGTPVEKVGAPGSGDFDGNGTVNIMDVLNLVQYLNGVITPTPAQFAAIDIDGSGAVTMVDAVLMVRKLV